MVEFWWGTAVVSIWIRVYRLFCYPRGWLARGKITSTEVGAYGRQEKGPDVGYRMLALRAAFRNLGEGSRGWC